MNGAAQNLREICRQYQALLLKEDEASITVALADAPTHEMVEALRFTSQRQVQVER